jgi:predicted acyltransferase
MAVGQWLARDPMGVRRQAWKVGVAFLAGFALLRYLDGFGNIRPRMGNSWMDYLTAVKYPPSITFVLLTMGLNLILWWALWRLSQRTPAVLQPLAVFGRTPFFFYVLHLLLFAALGHLFTPSGSSIPAMYPPRRSGTEYQYWLLGLVILFPLCWWYGRLKQRPSAPGILRFL